MQRSGTTVQFAAAGGHGSSGVEEPPSGALRLAAAVDDPLVRGLVDATALLAGLLLAGCGSMLAARRLAGAMATPPGPGAILAACGAAIALLVIADRGSRRGAVRMSGVLGRIGLVMAVASVALPLRSMSPAAAFAAITALGAAVVATGVVPLTAVVRLVGRRIADRKPPEPVSRHATVADAAALPPSATLPPPPPDGSLLQRFERHSLPDGTECVRGRVRVSVAAGSRLGVAHVGFCPPLAATPAVDVSTDYDGVEAVVSAAEVLPWGVRIECRLDEPAEEMIEIPVDLTASAPA